MDSQKTGPLTSYLLMIARAVLVLSILGCILLFLFLAVRYALPFLIACVLSFFLNPIVSFLERKTGLPRGLSSFIVLFSLFSLVIGMLLFTAMALIKGLSSLTRTVPGQLGVLIKDLQSLFFNKLLPFWEHALHLFSGLPEGQQKAIQLNIESMAQAAADLINNLAGNLISSLTQFVSSLPSTLVSALFIFLAAFFLSKDSEQIKRHLSLFKVSPAIAVPIRKVWQDLGKTCTGFVRAQFILVTLTMIVVYLGLKVLKTDQPFTIALISGAVDLIPYLGPSVIFIPWILYQFLMHHYFLTIGLTSLYAAVAVQRQLLEPKILSAHIGLDPLATLMALYFGFRWLGFAGLIIGPLSLVIVKALYRAGTLRAVWLFILGKK
ncbi:MULTISPECIES: sporulation integral membrane protein YtvI [unclassified Sporolactobacillus]|uniref:sporulation integral membrane protein YtvI n=1 Tax=unclassified Sporolactobacillus TaxID=2628533 RepID=UPI0023678EA0|nr:sporulation integral membrane protein YtvI [Sporolactobacillus sp. CQH2019]MDD9150829.1 sporulation integral membrane protein YtvI [Sporolactobacillus sp. CQH2019]